MATLATPLMTAEEFYDWVPLPEDQDRFIELDRGRVVRQALAGKLHGFVCANCAGLLGNFAARRRLGYVCSNNAGIITERDPDTVRGPDIVFFEDSQTADDMERRFAVNPPVLAVQVLSPTDRFHPMMVRVSQLLNRGVKLVWVVDPETRDVSVHRLGQPFHVISSDQEITGEDVLPDFRCRVTEFFDVPGVVT